MSGLITAGIELGFKIISWLIGKSQMNKQQKKAFLRFVESYDKLGNSSLKLSDDAKKQFDELKKDKETKLQ